VSLLVALVVAGCQLPPSPVLATPAQEAACALLEQPPATVAVDRRALEALLADPAFAHARDRKEAALEVALERLRKWLFSFFESSEAFEYAKLARLVVLVVAFVAALAGLLAVLRKRRRAQTASATGPVAALGLQAPNTHLARGRAALAAAPREAIREGLLALLSTLERRRLARPDRVKTNRELADELPARGADPALTARVRALLGWYDDAFYSLRPVDPGQASSFLDDIEKLGGAPS